MSGTPWWPHNNLLECDNKPRKGCKIPAVWVVGFMDRGVLKMKRLCYDCKEWTLWGTTVVAQTLALGEGHAH